MAAFSLIWIYHTLKGEVVESSDIKYLALAAEGRTDMEEWIEYSLEEDNDGPYIEVRIENPNDGDVEKLVEIFTDAGYDIKPYHIK